MGAFDDAYRRWLEGTRGKFVAKAKERRAKFETSSGIEVPALAAPQGQTDAQAAEYAQKQGFPGEYPFTRGVYPSMYRGRFWTMRQYAGFGDADESNKRYKYLLSQGTTGLSVAFDLPTQIGYDSDHAMAAGEVGKVGVAISTLDDMRRLFSGIPLDKVSTSMTINAPASVLLAMYICIAEEQGVPRSAIKGTVQNDVLKEYIARGTYIFPPAPSLRIITDIFAFCERECPAWNTISISGYHIREAGSTAAQEIAFTLANGIAYVEAAIKAGLNADKFGAQLSFFFNSHNNFFEEVAKFRAARRMWARIMKERFGATSSSAQQLRFHTQTAGSTLTAQQPENNIARTTLQAMAAVLGGTQSLHTNGFDEALALPTERAARIALRTQQIIAYESGAADTPDPLAGSYLVERLTDELEARALELIAKIDETGGSVKAIERGYQQDAIASAAMAYQRAVEKGEQVVVGVNQFQQQDPPFADILRVDEAGQARQASRVRGFKSRRNGPAAVDSLSSLRKAAQGTDNLMPLIIGALKADATLGEICDTLRGVFGEYQGR